MSKGPDAPVKSKALRRSWLAAPEDRRTPPAPPSTATAPSRFPRIAPKTPLLVAIVGGSGAGKSWLADQLKARLGPLAGRLSLDDFYRDRSHLALSHRSRINYDHPRAIDWASAERVLYDCLAGRATRVPSYDFTQHTRLAQMRVLRPKPIVLVEGLWWLRRPSLRRLFALMVFIDCDRQLRLHRRVARDLLARGRDKASVHRQFRKTVEPMNRRFVAPQARWAHVRLQSPIRSTEVDELERSLRAALAKTRFQRPSTRKAPSARTPSPLRFWC